ncbi:MAG: PAS domain S-box protein, partial [Spirochaetales bacterium]|nr:PAS domain S-box protein [Spirochaetales bacterium]
SAHCQSISGFRESHGAVTPVIIIIGILIAQLIVIIILIVIYSSVKKTEVNLRKQLDFNRKITETSPVGITIVNKEGQITYANQEGQKILGLTLSIIKERTYDDPQWKISTFDGGPFPQEALPFFQVMKSLEPVYELRHAIEYPDGKKIYLTINAVPLIDKENHFDGMIAAFQNITESEVLKRSLIESEQKYRSLFENMEDGFSLHEMVFDEQGVPVDYIFLDVNHAFEKQTKLKKEDILGRKVTEVLPGIEDDPADWIGIYGKVVLTGNVISFENFAKPLRKWYSVTAYRPEKGCFACLLHDITNTKRTAEALRNSQRLESLGVLAGGIAHDFNNLLGGLYNYIELAQTKNQDNEVSTYLARSLDSLDRARGLTQQLLTFAKGGAPIKKVDNLFPFIEDTVWFALSGSNVTCVFEIDKDLWSCNYDRNQIAQVIDNLIINAKQAMPDGGSINVKTNNRTFGENEHAKLKAGNYVCISITDTGKGIPVEIQDRIFDPFFSTKEIGQGLGLSMCYSIVMRHDGIIEFKTDPGKGSTFYVYLPAVTVQVASLASDNSNKNHKGSGFVIVMDDEEAMLESMQICLESFGYKVICTKNGKDTLNILSGLINAGSEIKGMLLDLTIAGGMSGKEVISEIRRLDSEIPVIVMSGYSEDPIMAQPSDYGFTDSICKPFRHSELIEKLNRFF